jgi:3-phenylpropionate/cinnamic acid dioxygenase small subunit
MHCHKSGCFGNRSQAIERSFQMDASRQIENLIYFYAEHIDLGDLDGVAALFRQGEILTPVSGNRSVGYQDVLALYRQAVRIYDDTGTPKTKHLTTNVIINVEGECANSRSYFTVIQATADLPLQPIISGRYHDKFICEGDLWRFEQRCVFVDHIGDCSAHLLYSTDSLN